MKCIVVMEGRFVKHDGRIVSNHLTYNSFWKRYLTVFNEIVVVARVGNEATAEMTNADGPGVGFQPIPPYRGLRQFLWQSQRVISLIKCAFEAEAAVILRVPGILGTIAHHYVSAAGRPYGLELVSDPYDAFARGSVSHPLRPFLRAGITRLTKKQARNACGVAYVTDRTLQVRYPCLGIQVGISSVELSEAAFAVEARTYGSPRRRLTIVTIASLAQRYKGVDVLLDALATVREDGHDVNLTVVGEGRYSSMLQEQAARLRLGGSVKFTGRVPAGGAVRAELDQADVFVLPSRTEGLPRAMIEAMARGLPCIGTSVGGIPELLPEAYLTAPNDVRGLAAKIKALTDADSEVLERASARNLEVARSYHRDILNARRVAFYSHVREATEVWQHERQ